MHRHERLKPAVVLQPDTDAHFRRGIDQISRLVSPTLGPRAGTVIVAPVTSRSPEVLDSGGLIARRTIQLSDRSDDVGAMFLRGLLWDIHEQAGDGVATACVVFKAVMDSATIHLASGVGAAQLRDNLLWGLGIVLEELDRITQPSDSPARLDHVARTLCREERLAATISEILAISGVHGHIEVRKGPSDNVAFEFLDGAYWKSSVHSTSMLSDPAARRIDIQRCRVLISDLEIQNERDVASLIDIARRSGAGGLVIVAKSLAPPCIAVILANTSPQFGIISVPPPDLTQASHESPLKDLEVLTNGRALHAAAGDLIGSVKLGDLGSARHVWADRAYIGVIRAGSDPFRLRKHVQELQRRFASSDDAAERERLALRISRLSGSCAIVWVDERMMQAAESATAGVRSAIRGGVLPGGGAALLTCQSVLRPLLETSMPGAKRAALRILHSALEAPMKTIILNGGMEPAPILSRVKEMGDGYGWDGKMEEIVDMSLRGILDPTLVTKTALRKAVAGAAQALTIDTIVHRRIPEQAMQP